MIKKTLALLVALSFVFSNIVFADVPKNANPDAKKRAEITVDPEKIIVPRDYGLVKSRYTAKDSKKLVIHIQDAHCNYEAQSNIIKILECLIKNDGLGLISVEGADGFIDTSWFKAFPDAEIRKEVADYFMKKGEITGPEFLSITSDYPVKLFGAETRSYYIENLNAFTSSYPLKEDTEKYFNQIKTIINKLKNYIYSEELREFDTKTQDYELKKLPFTDYVKYLESLGQKHKVGLRQYENLFKLVSVLIYEKKIDFSVVDKERAALIDFVTKKLDKEQLTELVNKSLEFKVGKIDSVQYYAYLKALAIKHGVSLLTEYPNLFNYIIYNSVYSRIENERLFEDIKKFEEAVKEKMFANDDQRTLDRLSRHINTLLGLVNIKLLNGDFDYYKSHKEEFEYEAFSGFINKMTTRYGFAYEIDAPSEAVKESMPKLEDFYAIAIKRDKALVDNTIEAMNKEDARISVLVTGGFHSEGIAKLLEKQNISYLVVCPNITKDVETPYIKILTNQRTPLEDILSDTGATTTEAKNVKGNMLAPYLITAARINNIGEIAGRTKSDLDAWAKINIALWLPAAVEAIKKMHIEPTPAVLAARFNSDVDKAVEEHIAAGSLDRRSKAALRVSAKEVKELSSPIIVNLLSAETAGMAVKDNLQKKVTPGLSQSVDVVAIKTHDKIVDTLRGIKDPDLVVLNFDYHEDNGPLDLKHPLSESNWVTYALQEGLAKEVVHISPKEKGEAVPDLSRFRGKRVLVTICGDFFSHVFRDGGMVFEHSLAGIDYNNVGQFINDKIKLEILGPIRANGIKIVGPVVLSRSENDIFGSSDDIVARVRQEFEVGSQSPAQPDRGVGSIRMNGGELTIKEHGTRSYKASSNGGYSVNNIIAQLIFSGRASSFLYYNKMDIKRDVGILLWKADPAADGITKGNVNKLRGLIKALKLNLVIVSGLKEKLEKLELAEDLLFHHGVTRNAEYIDEGDFRYLLSLPDGADIIMEGVVHEKVHIDRTDLSEDEVEGITSSTAIREAMIDRLDKEIKGLYENLRVPEMVQEDRNEIRGIIDLLETKLEVWRAAQLHALEIASQKGKKVFDHTDATIMQSSSTGESVRKMAIEKFKDGGDKHLIFVKSSIPAIQLASTTAINLTNKCGEYYNKVGGYTAYVVDNYEKAVELLAAHPDWNKTNTIVGIVDTNDLDAISKKLADSKMADKTKLLAMEKFNEDQFVPIKGFFDLMSVMVQINKPLDKDSDRELIDGIRSLLNEIGIKDVNSLTDALSVAAYFEDPIRFARTFLIRLLPPAKPCDTRSMKSLYDAAITVVKSL